jgi:type IV secretory pathway VirB6-like protein
MTLSARMIMGLRRVFVLISFMVALAPELALAAGCPTSSSPPSTSDCYTPPPTSGATRICTNDPFFREDSPCFLGTQVRGALETIITRIQCAVDSASRDIFDAITADSEFSIAVYASMVLMITFFAVAVMFGFINPTLGQAVIRLFKIGLVTWVVSPDGWTFMQDYFVRFFNDGTIYLVNVMVEIANSGTATGASSTDYTAAFSVLDGSLRHVFSPRMFVTAVAAFGTEPYGVAVGLALIFSIVEFVRALLRALLIFCLSLIVKALLFGLAPIFFVFLLFDRTKQHFMGWLNQLVNFSLQPILMFAFLAFFMTMIDSSARRILRVDADGNPEETQTHVCYVHSRQQGTTPFNMQSWEFVCPDGSSFQPYAGQRTARGPLECPGGPIFPISVVDILVFLLIVHIAGSIMSVIPALAAELSQGMVRLDQAIDGMGGFGGGGGGGRSTVQQRLEQRLGAPSGGGGR